MYSLDALVRASFSPRCFRGFPVIQQAFGGVRKRGEISLKSFLLAKHQLSCQEISDALLCVWETLNGLLWIEYWGGFSWLDKAQIMDATRSCVQILSSKGNVPVRSWALRGIINPEMRYYRVRSWCGMFLTPCSRRCLVCSLVASLCVWLLITSHVLFFKQLLVSCQFYGNSINCY